MKNSVKSFCSVLWNAFLPQNVVLVQALGLCPILAIGVHLQYGVALSLCTMAVLVPTALLSSWLNKYVSSKLRPLVYALIASVLLLAAALVLRQWVSPTIYAHCFCQCFLPFHTCRFTWDGTGVWLGDLCHFRFARNGNKRYDLGCPAWLCRTVPRSRTSVYRFCSAWVYGRRFAMDTTTSSPPHSRKGGP